MSLRVKQSTRPFHFLRRLRGDAEADDASLGSSYSAETLRVAAADVAVAAAAEFMLPTRPLVLRTPASLLRMLPLLARTAVKRTLLKSPPLR